MRNRIAGYLIRCAFLGAGLALFGPLPLAAAPASVTARTYYREASGAFEDKNYPAALALLEKAVALRPDYPRYVGALARLQALNDRPFDALTTLNRMGLFLDVEGDETLAHLHGTSGFADVIERFRANREPVGAGQVLFALPAMTGIIEGVAYRPQTGDFFFGDVRHRCVWLRQPDGTLRRFSAVGAGLLGVFGLKVDEARGSLWAATSAVPQMDDYQPADRNRAALVEFSLSDGRVRRTAALAADGAGHVVGDLTVAADGTVYAPDSLAPVIWRVARDGGPPQRWLESDEFASLQGAAVVDEGRSLLVSDYANGMFLIDLATRTIRPLAPPPDATPCGIDGIAAAPDGSVIGVQNGIEPRRIVRLRFDSASRVLTRLDVLERSHAAMADPTLGTLVDDRFVFVGDSGWDRFEKGAAPEAAAPRAVPIVVTRLPPPGRDR